jgi:hypothetical protein
MIGVSPLGTVPLVCLLVLARPSGHGVVASDQSVAPTAAAKATDCCAAAGGFDTRPYIEPTS